jgi:hypothetical protein
VVVFWGTDEHHHSRMKRSRATSGAARALSGATESGIIDEGQKSWLKSILADGDSAVESAVDQLVAGNPLPLRELVAAGNTALRTRLATLSFDGTGLRSSLSNVDLLAEDLRLSSIGGPRRTCFLDPRLPRFTTMPAVPC